MSNVKNEIKNLHLLLEGQGLKCHQSCQQC